MKKTLITGITDQDGSYLAEFLLNKNYQVHVNFNVKRDWCHKLIVNLKEGLLKTYNDYIKV